MSLFLVETVEVRNQVSRRNAYKSLGHLSIEDGLPLLSVGSWGVGLGLLNLLQEVEIFQLELVQILSSVLQLFLQVPFGESPTSFPGIEAFILLNALLPNLVSELPIECFFDVFNFVLQKLESRGNFHSFFLTFLNKPRLQDVSGRAERVQFSMTEHFVLRELLLLLETLVSPFELLLRLGQDVFGGLVFLVQEFVVLFEEISSQRVVVEPEGRLVQ